MAAFFGDFYSFLTSYNVFKTSLRRGLIIEATCIKRQKPLKSRFDFPAGERLSEQRCGVGCWNKPVTQLPDQKMSLVPQLRMLV